MLHRIEERLPLGKSLIVDVSIHGVGIPALVRDTHLAT